MDSKTIKQVLAFNKKAFDDSFKAVVAVQEHTEKMMRVFWEKSGLLPAESRQIAGDWMNAYKNGLGELKENVDSRFKLIEDYLLSVAGQMESSVKGVDQKAAPVETVPDMSKEVAVDLKKAASRRQTAKKRLPVAKQK